MSDSESFERTLLDQIVARLHLKDVKPDEVTSDTQLFEEGLGLDSLDALEITVLLEEEYGIVLSVAERNENVFGTLGTLAKFVSENRQRDVKK